MPDYTHPFILPKQEYCRNCGNTLPPYLTQVCSIECLNSLKPPKTKSDLRAEIYWFVIEYAGVYGYAPPLRAIGDNVYTSVSNARHHLDILIIYGLLALDANGKVKVPGAQLKLPDALQEHVDQSSIPFML